MSLIMTYQYSTRPEGVTYICKATANVDGAEVQIIKEIDAASMLQASREFEDHLDGGIEERRFGHHDFLIEITQKGQGEKR